MSQYYDRASQPMSEAAWLNALESDRRVAETTLPDGKWVSTIWMGLNHRWGGGPPLIFETMVFPSRHDFGDLDARRYSTLAEAEAGHAAMVEQWTRHPDGPPSNEA